jgi:hypothetical protein
MGWSWCTAWPCEIVDASMTVANGGSIPRLHAHESSGLTRALDWRIIPTKNVMWFPEDTTR